MESSMQWSGEALHLLKTIGGLADRDGKVSFALLRDFVGVNFDEPRLRETLKKMDEAKIVRFDEPAGTVSLSKK